MFHLQLTDQQFEDECFQMNMNDPAFFEIFYAVATSLMKAFIALVLRIIVCNIEDRLFPESLVLKNGEVSVCRTTQKIH